jgi:hypothetical protein
VWYEEESGSTEEEEGKEMVSMEVVKNAYKEIRRRGGDKLR